MNRTFAKVNDGVVIEVCCAGSPEWIAANPDRYGDASLWVECFQDGSGRGYCGVGDLYDSVNDVFVSPQVEVSE